MEIEIIDDRSGTAGRYHLMVDDIEMGELDYRDADGRRAFLHTGVRPTYQGRGLAAELVRRGLRDARARNLKVIPLCSYVEAYIARHPDEADLVAPAPPTT